MCKETAYMYLGPLGQAQTLLRWAQTLLRWAEICLGGPRLHYDEPGLRLGWPRLH